MAILLLTDPERHKDTLIEMAKTSRPLEEIQI